MANNYYDMTGVLCLREVTPVIQALFGAFELDAKYPGSGEAYIANLAETTSCSWNTVVENLGEYVKSLGLSVDEDDEETLDLYLKALATHFGIDFDAKVAPVLEDVDTEGYDAEIEKLFELARIFDDGHGLHAIKTESSWHCSKPRLFEFGGSGCFMGTHVIVDRSSDAAVRLGQDLETALVVKNVDEAAAVFLGDVRNTLSGIGDATTRDLIRVKLAELLVAPVASADVTS